MRTISSTKNPIVQAAKALQINKERKNQKRFLLDGEHMVGEAVSVMPDHIVSLFVLETKVNQFSAIINAAERLSDVYIVNESVMQSISQVRTSQGICAVCRIPGQASADELGNRIVLLENVQDPGNVGTIIRTLDAAGFTGCILTEGCADPYGDKALRATMGSLFRIPICFSDDAVQTCSILRESGFSIIGASLQGDPFYERDFSPEKICLLIGNEGAGLTKEIQSACTHLFRLPMNGGAESLNASIAAAIFMYDLMNR